MIVIFVYDSQSCTVFNMENEAKPHFFKQELGRCIVDLNPLHLSREIRWVNNKLKRLGYRKSHNLRKKVCEQVAHGLRAKEHICVEIVCRVV